MNLVPLVNQFYKEKILEILQDKNYFLNYCTFNELYNLQQYYDDNNSNQYLKKFNAEELSIYNTVINKKTYSIIAIGQINHAQYFLPIIKNNINKDFFLIFHKDTSADLNKFIFNSCNHAYLIFEELDKHNISIPKFVKELKKHENAFTDLIINNNFDYATLYKNIITDYNKING